MKFINSLILIITIQFCFSQQTPKELKDIESEINQLMKKYKAVGVSVAVVKNNKVIYSKGFGYRDLENKLPVTTNTIFPIGSVTKSFTGSVLGILASKNQVSLKNKPAFYLPNFEFYNDTMNNLITIEDLLSHKSGIGNQGTTQIFFPEKNRLKMVQRLKYLKPEAEVKNSFAYSNMAYTLAGTIIEQVTGDSWETNIKEKIFTPLEMTNSYIILDKMKKTSNYSLPYGIYKGEIERVTFEEFNTISAAGAIKSTVNDMTNWILTWLNNGVYKNSQIIPKEYIKKATTLQNSNEGSYEKDAFLFGEGFGWRLRSSCGRFRVEHGGNTYGFSSDLALFPFENIGIVVLTNQDNSLLPYMIVDTITRRLFNITPEPNYPVKVKEIYKPMPYKQFNKDKMPTYSLNSFCGAYEAKGFGRIDIVKENGKLYAILPTYKFQLEHLNYDSFFLKPTKEFKDVFNPQFDIQFMNNIKGKITSLKMYSQKEPIEFNKIQ
ncbi:serine hydrolase [Tenacibaculum discolor]|uniref:serine hydrolase n=1 Tax=Tenacibaculum discolor TaxID=361581 RepID=UPI000EB0AF68|nr:serine hydrolase [Tenacibaculum discolor]RLK02216.1 CubicO group peptidase (beta-lactamase class C family) [Tenacibaculum discolor]